MAHPNSFQSIPQHVETRYSDVAAVAAAMLGLRAMSHEPSCNCSNFVGVDMGQEGDIHRDQKASQALSTCIFCFILIYHYILL